MILGIDTSHWQGVMNYPKAVSSGARFNISRAGSINNITGNCYTDYQFPNNKYAHEHLPSGFYWFFRPNHDPYKQADYFCNLSLQTKRAPLTADAEVQGGCTPEQFRDSLAKFVGRIYANVGIWCEMYTRATVWNPHSRLVNGVYVKAGVAESALWPRLNLHIARYGVSQPWWTGTMYKPRDWNTWLFWQFSADGNGRGAEFGAGSNSIDLNYFNGDEVALRNHFFYDDAQPVPAPDWPRVVISRGDSRPLRYAPDPDAAWHGNQPAGVRVLVYAEKTVNGDQWLRLTPPGEREIWTARIYQGYELMRFV
jgi:GH25 family lysozyme M1 (1,4-beta-N-acetylmuramidase)